MTTSCAQLYLRDLQAGSEYGGGEAGLTHHQTGTHRRQDEAAEFTQTLAVSHLPTGFSVLYDIIVKKRVLIFLIPRQD